MKTYFPRARSRALILFPFPFQKPATQAKVNFELRRVLCKTRLIFPRINGPNLVVCNRNNGRVDQYAREGCFTGKTDYKFKGVTRITTTPDGFILVSDFAAKQIYILK